MVRSDDLDENRQKKKKKQERAMIFTTTLGRVVRILEYMERGKTKKKLKLNTRRLMMI